VKSAAEHVGGRRFEDRFERSLRDGAIGRGARIRGRGTKPHIVFYGMRRAAGRSAALWEISAFRAVLVRGGRPEGDQGRGACEEKGQI